MSRFVKLAAVPLFSVCALLTTGCGMNIASGGTGGGTTSAYTLTGQVQMPVVKQQSTGAQPLVSRPVSGATVYLYAAGTGGYGSAATLLAMTTTKTDGSASFSFHQDPAHVNSSSSVSSTYSCPSYTVNSADGTTHISADALIYLVAASGDTQDGSGSANSNKSSVMMTALGPCQSAGSLFVDINAVTTAASVFALAPYMAPTYPTASINGNGAFSLVGGALGTSMAYQAQWGLEVQGGYTPTGSQKAAAILPMGYRGLQNAFATVNNLVNISTGVAIPSFTKTGSVSGAASLVVTGTPESAKLNTIANILAACVDSSDVASLPSAQCVALFASAKPPISSASTSLGAGYTYGAAADTLQAAYYMATNPTDNTAYGGDTSTPISNLGLLYATSTAFADFQPALTAQPSDWTLSISYSSTGTCGTDATPGAAFSSLPWTAATDTKGDIVLLNGVTLGKDTLVGFSPDGTPQACAFGTMLQGRSVAFDLGSNIWASGSGANNVWQYTGSDAPINWPTTDGTTNNPSYAMVADGKGNIFYTSTTAGSLYEFVGAAATTTPTNAVLAGTAITGGPNLYYVAADALGNIWSSGAGTSSTTAYVWGVNGSGYVTNQISGTGISTSYGAAIDGSGKFIGGNTCCASAQANEDYKVAPVIGPAGVITGSVTHGVKSQAGVLGVRAVAVDGAGNIWNGIAYAPASYASGANTYGLFAVGEVDNSFNALSPTGTGSACTATGTLTNTGCNVGGGYQKATLGVSRGLVVDISGNVWVPSDLSSNTGSAAATNGNLVEIIGAAVPTVQPLAVAARDNKLGQKP